MKAPEIPLKDLVLVGGGHAHVHVIKMLRMSGDLPHVRVTLISRDTLSPYSGMIPGLLCGYYSKEDCHIDLLRLCAFAGVRFIHAEAIGIDRERRVVLFRERERPPLRYDVLSVDIGISPSLNVHVQERSTANNTHAASIVPVKPIDQFADHWERVVRKITAFYANKHTQTHTQIHTHTHSEREKRELRIAIVGGGGGGIELAFAMKYRCKEILRESLGEGDREEHVHVDVYNRAEDVMSSHGVAVRETVKRFLTEKGITVHNNQEIVCVETDSERGEQFLVSKTGERFLCDEAFWCTQASTQSWLRETGLALDDDGFILVNPTLESVNSPGIFACGDVCHNVMHPRPKAGVFAVRAGPPLLANLKHFLMGEPLEEWTPQDEFLGIINTGDRHAIASKGGVCVEGDFLFTLKDRIDVTWMAGYHDALPPLEEMMKKMESAPQEMRKKKEEEKEKIVQAMEPSVFELLAKAKMRCAGCGSKVGASILSRALKRVRAISELSVSRPEVLAGIGDDAALIRLASDGSQSCIVQTIDYFKSFVADGFLFGQIAANHALSDVFAMNAQPLSAMALCVLPYGREEMVEDELVQVLAGVLSVLKRENCALVGGHTAEGAEPSLGISVTGVLSHPSQAFAKGPLRRDCSLILTKALGTGTILAADMRAQAKGVWVRATYESMLLSNSPAAKVLASFNTSSGDNDAVCVACTDVTGFGLLGHLIEMIQHHSDGESEKDGEKDLLAVDLFINQVPTLPGAIDCVKKGILSSLHPQNIRCNQAVGNIEEASKNDIYPLLFDPQTSGGLLACVATSRVEEVLSALRSAGYADAAEIGRVSERSDEEFAPLVQIVL